MTINPRTNTRKLSEMSSLKLAGLISLVLSLGIISSFQTGAILKNELSPFLDTDASIKTSFEMQSAAESLEESSNNSTSVQINEQTGDSVSISNGRVNVDISHDSRANIHQSESSISVKIESNSSSETPSTPNNPPILSINGEEVPLPKNGRVSETFKNDNTKTRLRADIDGEGSSSVSISTKTSD